MGGRLIGVRLYQDLMIEWATTQWGGCTTEKCKARDHHVQGWDIAVKHVQNVRLSALTLSKSSLLQIIYVLNVFLWQMFLIKYKIQ